MKSGFISIVGRPNAGKSTLINAIVEDKIAITSSKPQTTRNIIQGIYNESGYQIVFVDTPGVHHPINRLGRLLNKQAFTLMQDVDLILFVTDANEFFGPQEKYILNVLKEQEIPVALVINKIDLITKEELLSKIDKYKKCFSFKEIIPVSAMRGINVKALINICKKYLTDDVRYFDNNVKTSNSTSFMISEFVREKVLELTEKEVPYAVTCLTTNYEEKKDIINIMVDIIVERDSLKKIVIGKKGAMLKEIGSQARQDIEKKLQKKVYLELYVKTIKNWRDKEKHLIEYGFKDFE